MLFEIQTVAYMMYSIVADFCLFRSEIYEIEVEVDEDFYLEVFGYWSRPLQIFRIFIVEDIYLLGFKMLLIVYDMLVKELFGELHRQPDKIDSKILERKNLNDF